MIGSISTGWERLQFRGAEIGVSDHWLLVVRKLDGLLGLSDSGTAALRDSPTGQNTPPMERRFGLAMAGWAAGREPGACVRPFGLGNHILVRRRIMA